MIQRQIPLQTIARTLTTKNRTIHQTTLHYNNPTLQYLSSPSTVHSHSLNLLLPQPSSTSAIPSKSNRWPCWINNHQLIFKSSWKHFQITQLQWLWKTQNHKRNLKWQKWKRPQEGCISKKIWRFNLLCCSIRPAIRMLSILLLARSALISRRGYYLWNLSTLGLIRLYFKKRKMSL